MLLGRSGRALSVKAVPSLASAAAAILSKYGGSLLLIDASGVFVNSDGSVLAGAGSVAGYIASRGIALPAKQTTTSRKPLLQNVANRWGLKFDGIDDALTTAALPAAAAETFGFVYTAPPIVSGQFPLSRRNAGTSIGSAFYLNGTSGAACFINGTSAAVTGAVVAPGAAAVVSAVGRVGSVAVRVNGVDGSPVTYSTYVSGTGVLTIGNSQDLVRPFAGSIHAIYHAPSAMTEADRRALDVILGKIFSIQVAA